jgi:glutamine synthetase
MVRLAHFRRTHQQHHGVDILVIGNDDELKQYLNQYPDTQYMELMVADMNGILRGKRAPLQDLGKAFKNGVNFCAATVSLDPLGSTFDNVPFGSVDGDPDVRARIVPGSLANIPWAALPTGQAMLELSELDGTSYYLDAREVLKRALQPLRDLGLNPVMATELEFYLVEHDGEKFNPRFPRMPGSNLPQKGPQYALLDDLSDVDEFLATVHRFCKTQNVPAGAAMSEFSPGQFEINLQHVDDPLRACEHALLLKRIVKAAARQHGLDATFMAKPFQGIPGSGLHIHVSLLDGAGNNVFAGNSKDGAFSDTLRHAIGGLAKLMPQSMALFAPNANSYKRFQLGVFAPVDANWGFNHRAVSLRIPLSGPTNTRVEHRVSGADANPYLVTAALMAGLHHGITNQCEPGKMVKPREIIEEKVNLPIRWPLALEKFSQGEILPEYLGTRFCQIFTACRQEEEDRFHAEISNRDYEWYLRSA